MVTHSVAASLTIKCLFSPCGKWFAVGGADAIVSIWDAYEYIPVRTISRLEWPVRTLSFSHNGKLLAAASEDHVIDISHVSYLIKKYRWCVFPMVVISLLPHAEFGRNDHEDDAPILDIVDVNLVPVC